MSWCGSRRGKAVRMSGYSYTETRPWSDINRINSRHCHNHLTSQCNYDLVTPRRSPLPYTPDSVRRAAL